MEYILKKDVVKGVNLPRWGLKLIVGDDEPATGACKFTPLGFETRCRQFLRALGRKCKFTPLGFETQLRPHFDVAARQCKFTPLGFETIAWW